MVLLKNKLIRELLLNMSVSIFSQTLGQIQVKQVLIILAKSSEKEGGKNIVRHDLVRSKGGLCNRPLIYMSLALFDPQK